MKASSEKSYDQAYSASNSKSIFNNGEHEKYLNEIIGNLQTGTVLDLGAGDGRNSLFFSSHGFEVTAIDLSAQGIAKLNRIANEQGLNINAQVANILDFEITQSYNIILCSFVLQHLKREQAIDLIKRMQDLTLAGGYNFIAGFNKGGDFDQMSAGMGLYYVNGEELKTFYQEWNIVLYKDDFESRALRKNENGEPMKNKVTRILARKK